MFIFIKSNLIQVFLKLNAKFNNSLLFKKNKTLNNNKGMAVLETIPLLVVFMVLMTYAMGFWGSIHASILNSMAARTYAFETFRNRSNLTKFRETQLGKFYVDRSLRFHGINDGNADVDPQFIAPKMPISFSDFQLTDKDLGAQGSTRHSEITAPTEGGRGLSSVSLKQGVNPIWIQIGYGYCLDLECTVK